MHLHANKGIHRYLTPKNVMYDAKWEPRLVDFGFAKIANDQGTNLSLRNDGDAEYGAPECIVGTEYDETVDVFSFAMILLEILTDGAPLWGSGKTSFVVMKALSHGDRPLIPPTAPEFWAKIIRNAWAQSPDSRPMMADIVNLLLNHDEPPFGGVDMIAYREYRQKVFRSTTIAEDFRQLFDTPKVTAEDQAKFAQTKAAADRGDTEQQVRVAAMYETGRGIVKDGGLAVQYYLKAARSREPFSMFKVGCAYYYGNGVEKSDSEAMRWLSNVSGDSRLPLADVIYGLMLRDGRGCAADPASAAALFRRAADAGCPEAQYYYAHALQEGKGVAKNTPLAVTYFRQAAANGVEGATVDFANMIAKGDGVPQDVNEALVLLGTAAAKGSGMAYCNMGWIYELPQFGRVDEKKALSMFEKAAELKLPEGMFKFGLALVRGLPRPDPMAPEVIRAVGLFKQAADKGYLQAQIQYGKLLAEGRLCGQNVALGKLYLDAAARAGSSFAMVILAEVLLEGRQATPRDVSGALNLLRQAAALRGTPAEQKQSDRANEILRRYRA
jgi:TPR repeat protein